MVMRARKSTVRQIKTPEIGTEVPSVGALPYTRRRSAAGGWSTRRLESGENGIGSVWRLVQRREKRISQETTSK